MSLSPTVTQAAVTFAAERVVLVGAPRRCVGIVPVRNPQTHDVKLRRLRFLAVDEALRACCRNDAIEVVVGAELCAEQTHELHVRVRLPETTPPGVYQARLEGQKGCAQAVEIRVLEWPRASLEPNAFARVASPGESFTLPMHVSNRGNVPLEIPPRLVVELHAAERGWTYHLHRAFKAHGPDGTQATLDGFVRRIGREEPPLGRAKVEHGAGVLPPGETRLIELRVSLPKQLRARRRYRAIVRLAGTHMSIALQVTTRTPSELR